MKQHLFFISALVFMVLPLLLNAQLTENRTPDPAKAQFVYQDISTFLNAFKKLKKGVDTTGILQREYIDKGSAGLKIFIEKYGMTAQGLTRAIGKNPDSYRSIEKKFILIKQLETEYREGYKKIKAMIPSAEFPPTYYLVSTHRGIGSGSIEGTLITIEKDDEHSIKEDFLGTLVHEMMHMQQLRALGPEYFVIFNEKKSLLALSIREGAAEYLAWLIVEGKTYKAQFLDYVLQNEKRLWEGFKKEMLGKETGDWLWSKPKDAEQPDDIGYLIGFRIVESFYKKSTDKKSAAERIIAVTDYKKFLDESGYMVNQ